MSAGIAIFVKTPGLSPVKTRLAAGVGKFAALEFYDLACEAVRSVAERAAAQLGGGAAVYWAVAEEAGLQRWRARQPGLPVVAQGEGGLGERLDRVYAELLAAHGEAYLIGADGPQIAAADFAAARQALAGGAAFTLGPARDGGFWLMAGRRPVPRADWTAVPYSEAGTGAALAARLERLGPVALLGARGDVDVAEDLAALADDLAALPELTTEQTALRVWAEELRASRGASFPAP